MSKIWLITCAELRLYTRDGVAVAGAALATLVVVIAAFVAAERADYLRAARSHYQSLADGQFENQPDRHPHRVVHYGHFAFRPPGLLSGFDPGIESFVGPMIYLEGHRQNTANFGEARKSPLLLRFGELSPAFVLQVLWPLLLIFIGYGAIARERERGYLKPLLAQGVAMRQILTGKWLALGIVALLLAAPAFIALLILGWSAGTHSTALVALVGYVLYLLTWAAAIVLISGLSRGARASLFGCLAVWALLVIVTPRLLSEVASIAVKLPTRVETDITIQQELAAMGDSHNPDDPYFAAFRAKILASHGVSRVEDLPVNYAGLLGVEGERMTSELFDKYSARTFSLIEAQNRWVETVGVITPLIALRGLSMNAAGSGWSTYREFLKQVERYRFVLVQALNTLQAEKLSYADDTDDSKEGRIDAGHFRALPEFEWKPPAERLAVGGMGMPLLMLLGWAAAILIALMFTSHRMTNQ